MISFFPSLNLIYYCIALKSDKIIDSERKKENEGFLMDIINFFITTNWRNPDRNRYRRNYEIIYGTITAENY